VRYDIPSFWHTSLGFSIIIKLTYKVYKLLGLLETADNGVGKAILEGRLKESVMNFAERNFFRVTPESSLETARKLMISSSRFFLPVVDFRTLLGSVSWKEVFDNLNKEAYVS
jgi:predicted transcriptional regulator